MKLINADYVKGLLELYRYHSFNLDDALYVIDSAPAYTERTSVWVVKTKSTFPQYQPDEYECPYCKKIVNYITDYCPHCGTHMKGVIDNAEQ